MNVQVALFKSNGIGAALIRWFTFSRWNHAGIWVNGTFYEATFLSGVTKQSIPNGIQSGSHARVLNIELPEEGLGRMVEFLEAQLGKPYDWKAIFALPWRESWQSSNAWFCSELVAKALSVGGIRVGRELESHRVTPRDLWVALPMISGPIERVKY